MVRTGERPRTEAAFAAIGLNLLRRNKTVRAGVIQSFYRPSETTIELLAPLGSKQIPAAVWGITFVCDDLDACHRRLPSTTKPPWEAVQPGRRITVLNGKEHGITLSVASMSTHVKFRAKEEELRKRAEEQEEQLRKRHIPIRTPSRL